MCWSDVPYKTQLWLSTQLSKETVVPYTTAFIEN